MGHIVRSSGSQTSQKSFDLLRCLQEMPQTNSANTCYTAGRPPQPESRPV